MSRWNPALTEPARTRRPPVGRLIAYHHGVWRITAVTNLPLDEETEAHWVAENRPDLDAWHSTPYGVCVEYVGGYQPRDGSGLISEGRISSTNSRLSWMGWHLYPESGRWPMCSCCGEPMPCRAELQDQQVAASLDRVEALTSILPGCCWACREPISRRQQSVAYPGENLLLPGGPEVRFHIRGSCWDTAKRYELAWIAQDPRRERIITYPKCRGILIIHSDGSDECVAGTLPIGGDAAPERDCRGHSTHDHATVAACYSVDNWFGARSQARTCHRGCDPTKHPGARPPRRPVRRASGPSLLAG